MTVAALMEDENKQKNAVKQLSFKDFQISFKCLQVRANVKTIQ